MATDGKKNRIAERRRAVGLTQVKLAELLGTTGNSISRLENGDTRLNLEWMERIAKVLGCEPADLIANGKDETAKPDKPEIIANWIDQGLGKPGKSGKGLAKALGVNEAIVSRMRSGQRRFHRADQLEKIAEYIEEPIPLSPRLPKLESDEPNDLSHGAVLGLRMAIEIVKEASVPTVNADEATTLPSRASS